MFLYLQLVFNLFEVTPSFFICIFSVLCTYYWPRQTIQPKVLKIISGSKLISTQLKIMMSYKPNDPLWFQFIKGRKKFKGSILNDIQVKDSYKH